MSDAEYEASLNAAADTLEAQFTAHVASSKKLSIAVVEMMKAAVRARIRASELAAQRKPKEP